MTPLMTMPCNLGAEGRHGASLKFDEIDGRFLFGEHYVDTILKPKTLFLFEILDSVPGAPKSKLHEGLVPRGMGLFTCRQSPQRSAKYNKK